MNQEVLVILIIGGIMFIPLWIGNLAGNYSTGSSEDFFLQQRNMGAVALYFTVAATWWSSFAFLGSNAYFYSLGPVYWTAIAWNILFGLMYYLVGKRVWFYGKINHYITPSDFFRDIYQSDVLGNLVTYIMLLFTLPYIQIQLTGGAYLIHVASNTLIPREMAGLIFYAVIVIYVWTGGLRAVAWTDIFYGTLLFTGLILIGFYFADVVGGTTQLFATINETAPEHLTLPGPTGTADEMMWISMFFITPLGALMGPPLWIRMYAARSSKIFNLMPLLLSLTAITYLGSMLLGNAGMLLEPGLQEPDTILPVMLYKYAPVSFASLILVCGAAASMSTVNSQLHALSAVYTMDVHRKYFNGQQNIRLVTVGRWMLLVFAAIAYFMSILIPGLLIPIGLVALSGTAQVIVPTMGALFWKKSTAAGAISGLLGGITFLLIFTFVSSINPFWRLHPGMAALIINCVLFVSVSMIPSSADNQVYLRISELKILVHKHHI
jgi:solute:Na+ symporter, SSS family